MQLSRLRSTASVMSAHSRVPAAVRGACPGSFTPMASGDGWLIRLRTSARALDSATLRQLARLAHVHGNGIIELTRRANLQLRGLRLVSERVPELRSELIALGLVDASPEREGRPALVVDPVAALDPHSGIVALARALDVALSEYAADGGTCSPKLGIVLDAESGSVSILDADIRLVTAGASTRVQVYVSTPAAEQLLIECERAAAPVVLRTLLGELAELSVSAADGGESAAVDNSSADPPPAPSQLADASPAARRGGAFTTTTTTPPSAQLARPSQERGAGADPLPAARRGGARMRELVAVRGMAGLRAKVAPLAAARSVTPPRRAEDASGARTPSRAAVGLHQGWFGLAVPFGSGTHEQWLALAELAERYGDAAVRFTPAREVLISGVRAERAGELADAARTLGLIVEASDPRRRIVACSGAPACSSGYGETRALASLLAEQASPLLAAGATLHVSGCEKGCASRAATELNVVLAPGGCARLALNVDIATASLAAAEPLAVVATRLSELTQVSIRTRTGDDASGL